MAHATFLFNQIKAEHFGHTLTVLFLFLYCVCVCLCLGKPAKMCQCLNIYRPAYARCLCLGLCCLMEIIATNASWADLQVSGWVPCFCCGRSSARRSVCSKDRWSWRSWRAAAYWSNIASASVFVCQNELCCRIATLHMRLICLFVIWTASDGENASRVNENGVYAGKHNCTPQNIFWASYGKRYCSSLRILWASLSSNTV